jgi:hypothetical protein
MAVYITINEVCRQIREKNAKFWRISSGDETAVIARMIDDSNDLESSIEELQTVYNEISGDWVKIKANNVLIEGRGGDTRSAAYEWRVRCKNNTEKEIIHTKNNDAFGSNSMFNMVLSLMEKNYQLQRDHDKELAEFKNKELIRELEARAEGKNSGYMMEGIGLLKQLMNPEATNEAAISGLEENVPLKPVYGSNGEKIKLSLKTLASVDKNLANNLELLAKLAKKDPNMYNMAVNYLKTL